MPYLQYAGDAGKLLCEFDGTPAAGAAFDALVERLARVASGAVCPLQQVLALDGVSESVDQQGRGFTVGGGHEWRDFRGFLEWDGDVGSRSSRGRTFGNSGSFCGDCHEKRFLSEGAGRSSDAGGGCDEKCRPDSQGERGGSEGAGSVGLGHPARERQGSAGHLGVEEVGKRNVGQVGSDGAKDFGFDEKEKEEKKKTKDWS